MEWTTTYQISLKKRSILMLAQIKTKKKQNKKWHRFEVD